MLMLILKSLFSVSIHVVLGIRILCALNQKCFMLGSRNVLCLVSDPFYVWCQKFLML